MATYAIGDIQGCYSALRELLELVDFGSNDTLWCVGDLVNRGGQDLDTLIYLHGLGDQVITVLGNHDLHLLACYYGVRKPTKKDTFTEVLASPECDTLLDWLRQQPLLHHDASLGYTLTHAGIPPIWTIAQARSYAREVETALRSIDPSAFFNTMYGNEPATWSTSLEGTDRLRTITNYLTRMRFCAPDGKLEFATKSGPEAPPPGYLPWYLYPEHLCTNERLLFGHWAALSGDTGRPNFVGLDTGCVWGGELSLMRLEDGQRYCVDCAL